MALGVPRTRAWPACPRPIEQQVRDFSSGARRTAVPSRLPPKSIAGRSPSYIVRQLFDIRSGLRAGAQVAPMVEVAKRLHTEEMVEIAAYLATLH